MNRLTIRTEKGNAIINPNIIFSSRINEIIINELAKFEDAQEQKRIWISPCKAGDTVFVNTKCENIIMQHDDDWIWGTGAASCPFEKDCPHEDCDDSNIVTVETQISQFLVDEDSVLYPLVDGLLANFNMDSFGKTIFMSRDVAVNYKGET